MRRFLALAFALAALVCAPVPTSAQQTETFVIGQNLDWLYINDGAEFSVHVLDEVEDGCWTNTEAAKNAVAIELQRSGYKVNFSDENVFGNRIFLYALGYESTDISCIAKYDLSLLSSNVSRKIFDEKNKVLSIHSLYIWRDGGLMSGRKSGMNQRIKGQFVELAQRFLLHIKKERGEVLKAVREAAEENKDKQPEAYRYWMAFPD